MSRLRAWRATHGELSIQGRAGSCATVLPSAVKLVVMGVLFYAAFWLVLLLIGVLFVVARSCGKSSNDFSLPRDELRYGEAGFGLYSSDEQLSP